MRTLTSSIALPAIAALILLCGSPASFAANTFQQVTPVGGRYWLTNTDNWSDGVLPDTTQGVINASTDGTLDAATDWDVIQNGSTIGISGAGTSTILTDSTWTLNGGQLGDVNLNLSSSTVSVQAGGTLKSGAGNRDITVNGTSVVTVNGGTVDAGRRLWMRDTVVVQGNGTFSAKELQISGSAHFNVNNSTVTLTEDFGHRAKNTGGGKATLAGTTLTAPVLAILDQGDAFELNFAGAGAGSATFEDWAATGEQDANADQSFSIDFASATGMTMTMSAPSRGLNLATGSWTATQWAEGLWVNNQLTYNAADSTTLGDWSTVTSTGLGDGNLFTFDGNTLAVAPVPEPSTFALVAIAFLPLRYSRGRK
jgi:hypothetical protein